MTANEKTAFRVQLAKDDKLELAHTALLMATYLGERVDPAVYLNRLTGIAAALRPMIEAEAEVGGQLECLNRYFFQTLGFNGNERDYYHPVNSCLNKVLDLRTGIPISLRVLYLELGWQVGLPLYGVGMPLHFIVGCRSDGQPHFIDVFNEGNWLSEEDCLEICQLPLSDLEPFRREHLQPVSKKAILFRMLLNLKQIYINQKGWERAYKVVDLLLEIQPDQPGEIRDRGLIAYRLNHLQEAIFDIKHYLSYAPEQGEAEWLRDHVTKMEEKLLRSN
jgi:regulator of sirC expression with transglutaminase-like and TPR domain